MADRNTRKRQRTRDHLAQAAAALFEKHGYEAITMEQIAAAADVARGTLYNHFPVKEAVLAHWLHTQLAEALGLLVRDALARPSFVAQVATLLEASAAWWEEHRSFAAPYIRYRFQEVREEQGDQPTSDMIPVYAQLIGAAQESGEVSKSAPSERLALYLHYLYLCALMNWLADSEKSLPQEFTHALDFFMQGAAARKK